MGPVHPICLVIALPAEALPVLHQSAAASRYCGKTKELAHTADSPNVDPSKTGEIQAVTTAKVEGKKEKKERGKCAFSVLFHVFSPASVCFF